MNERISILLFYPRFNFVSLTSCQKERGGFVSFFMLTVATVRKLIAKKMDNECLRDIEYD